MKAIKYIGILFIAIFISSCKDNSSNDIASVYQCPMKCEAEKTFDKPGSCSVCNMDLQPIAIELNDEPISEEISETSIFNLDSKWHTEEGETILLEDLKGKTLVMVMIYTTCKAACPRLVADMRNIEKQIPNNKDLRYVLVSIDPVNDTPERLKAFAIENQMDAEHWTFLQGTESTVREFANVLAVKYKQISPLDFSHSNIISVFNDKGELMHQQEGLGVDNKETVSTILELVK
ncbi:SCO family protein [Pontimicrobium sp. SW4]|uniref:SCO family protein n=1 Tax=Pontimicrobium sp. SW4 TaxID=3153519 RepID=A0AAU7BP79_9FLAO